MIEINFQELTGKLDNLQKCQDEIRNFFNLG